MNTDDFKKLLRESLESEGENLFNEVAADEFSGGTEKRGKLFVPSGTGAELDSENKAKISLIKKLLGSKSQAEYKQIYKKLIDMTGKSDQWDNIETELAQEPRPAAKEIASRISGFGFPDPVPLKIRKKFIELIGSGSEEGVAAEGWKPKYKEAMAIVGRWYDQINNTPVESESDAGNKMKKLLDLGGKLREHKVISQHMKEEKDNKVNKAVEYYKTLDNIFKENNIETMGPGAHGLGFPKFETFLKIAADWDEKGINTSEDLVRVFITSGAARGMEPGRERMYKPDDELREFLTEATEYDDQARGIMKFLNVGDIAKILISYIQKLVKNKISRSRGYESAEDEAAFTEKGAAKIIPKLERAIKNIQDASGELTAENMSTLFKYYIFGKYLGDPEMIQTLHDNSFADWVMSSINSLMAENQNIQQIFQNVIGAFTKFKLYKDKPGATLKKLFDAKKYKHLQILDTYLLKKPNTNPIRFIQKEIDRTAGDEESLNESFSRQGVDEYLKSFMPFAKKRLGYDEDPEIKFISDPENAQKTLGKTAQYEPENMIVSIYIDGRHPKDVMRSLSHELVHHAQNCDGQFDQNLGMGEGYAQNDKHLRKMEEDAYLRGNMCFRDWEDKYKQTNRAFGNSLNERRERLYYELVRRLW